MKVPDYKREQFRVWKRRPSRVYARQVESPELVNCYNGDKIAKAGEFIVVVDGDVMIMKHDKFHRNFMEDSNESN